MTVKELKEFLADKDDDAAVCVLIWDGDWFESHDLESPQMYPGFIEFGHSRSR